MQKRLKHAVIYAPSLGRLCPLKELIKRDISNYISSSAAENSPLRLFSNFLGRRFLTESVVILIIAKHI